MYFFAKAFLFLKRYCINYCKKKRQHRENVSRDSSNDIVGGALEERGNVCVIGGDTESYEAHLTKQKLFSEKLNPRPLISVAN